MPASRSARRRSGSTRRWWIVSAIAVTLSVAGGLIVSVGHGTSQSAALQMSASVRQERAVRGSGHGGYVVMPGPGQAAVINASAREFMGNDRPAHKRLGARWESNKQWDAWYQSWHEEGIRYWENWLRQHRHHPGTTATATPTATATTPTATATAAATPTVTATTPAATATATTTPTATATSTATATPTASATSTATATATPTAAATTATATATPTTTTTGVTQTNSLNWSGYAATGAAGTFTTVASGWIVPALTCATATDMHSSFGVGLDGLGTGSGTAQQIGTEGDCDGNFPVYSAWFEMFPNAPVTFDEVVKPGDIMEASVTAEGAGVFMLTIFDMTENWSQVTEQASATATLGSAEVITEAPPEDGAISSLSDFGTVVFAGAAINNAAITTPIDEITMVSAEDVTLAVPSAITGGIGNFTVGWDASGP
jgi:hypothetical protein